MLPLSWSYQRSPWNVLQTTGTHISSSGGSWWFVSWTLSSVRVSSSCHGEWQPSAFLCRQWQWCQGNDNCKTHPCISDEKRIYVLKLMKIIYTKSGCKRGLSLFWWGSDVEALDGCFCESLSHKMAPPPESEAENREQGQAFLLLARESSSPRNSLADFSFHWAELDHIAIHPYEGDWEIWYFFTMSRMGWGMIFGWPTNSIPHCGQIHLRYSELIWNTVGLLRGFNMVIWIIELWRIWY